ncbi:sensor domain-containing protein [Methylovulum psychrotolerans]|uniref:PAS domain S-box protein n=1 Tax=Methylovulum psychrotolerans TaxID=1704499 RepID=A0A2S5CIJ2_9GAMM|nr:EAL domain-containing protein [Methylovulum psychrotolerans]POZ50577.1 PAS domain S-box protein [Methylovulum psychrotolerans]
MMQTALPINGTDAVNILTTVSDAVMVTDADGIILYANPAAHSLLDREDLLGKNAGLPVMATRKPIDVHLVRRSGLGWAQLRALPIQWAGQTASVLTLTDITELKTVQQQISESEAILWVILDNLPFLVWMKDTAGRYVHANKQWLHSAGQRDIESVMGKTDADFWPDSLAKHYRAIDNDVLQTRRQIKLLEQALHNGRETWVETTKLPVIDNDGQLLGVIGFAHDITAERTAEEQLKLAASIFEYSGEGMIVTDTQNKMIAVNPAFTKLTGYSAAEVIGENPRILGSGIHHESFYQDMWDALQKMGFWSGEITDKKKNGDFHVKKMCINVIPDSEGKPYRYVGLFSDITDAKNNEATIWHQANYDILTELPNRRLFQDRLDQEIKKAKRSEALIAVLFIDLDNFKEVNDTLGHHAGDALLVEASKRIKSCVSPAETVSRFGGDEFLVILACKPDSSSHIESVAQKILATLQEPIAVNDELFFISGSMGITLYPHDAGTSEELIKNADQALYVAKSTGRNRASYFTNTMQEQAQAKLKLTTDLRTALKEKQFRVFYQPIVDLLTGKIGKAEALVRWFHPTRGMVSPADFIPLAEETGLIIELGDWIFKEAANFTKYISQKTQQTFQISINKSPFQFHEKLRGEDWIAYLSEIGLHRNQIVVEITEGLLLNSDPSVTKRLLEYRDAGIEVAIDDFGTGYSSLAYLNKFDIDYLKIDQSFTKNIRPGTSELAISEAIIVMAHKLGLRVIAEGVETEAQRDLLIAAGCDFAQGYLYSKPLPSEAFEKLFTDITQ